MLWFKSVISPQGSYLMLTNLEVRCGNLSYAAFLTLTRAISPYYWKKYKAGGGKKVGELKEELVTTSLAIWKCSLCIPNMGLQHFLS